MITADGRTVVFHILHEVLGDSDADSSPPGWLGDLDFDGIDGGCLDATAMLSSEREEASDDHDLQPAESEEVEGGHVEAAPLAMVAIVEDDASDEQEPERTETPDGDAVATAAVVHDHELEPAEPEKGEGGTVEAAPLTMGAIVVDDSSDEQEPEPAETEDGGEDATAALVEAEFEVPYNSDGEGEEEEPEVDLPAKLELDSD